MPWFSNSIKKSPNYEKDKAVLDGYIDWINTLDASDYADMVLLTLPGDWIDFYKNPDIDDL